MMPDVQSSEKGNVKFASPGSDPNLDLLSKAEQQTYYKKILDSQIAASNDLQNLALRELKSAIRKAKITQTVILVLNVIMFFFGLILISVAVYGGFTGMSDVYALLFGGVGFADIVASFFVGAMQRSQNSVSDLVQVEIAFLNYFEQVRLWEQYASVRDDQGKIQKENLAKAAEKIQESTAQSLELLQKYIESVKT
ncbi:MAG: hypothetical protein WC342_07310 [Methanoregula sp.]|jgi:hypothetical protein